MNYLDVQDLVYIARRTLGHELEFRDIGLLESAAARPGATGFGQDAYQTVFEKASALTHSIARNDALVDGNKRLALAALIVFLGINGYRLTWDNDQAYDVIIAIATGQLNVVTEIAPELASGTEPLRDRAGR